MRKSFSEQEREQIVNDYDGSISLEEYCELVDIGVSTFHCWRRNLKLKNNDDKSNFIELDVNDDFDEIAEASPSNIINVKLAKATITLTSIEDLEFIIDKLI